MDSHAETVVTSVHIICIGSYLLDGSKLDTNIHWLCKRLTSIGARVERSVIVRHDCGAVMVEIRQAVLAPMRLVICIGGMGPAAGDLALYAIGRATYRSLKMNVDALKMVEEKYALLAGEGRINNAKTRSAREKMARLPEGALPVHNPVGVAPAMILNVRGTTILLVPDVREELQELFNGPLLSMLNQILGDGGRHADG